MRGPILAMIISSTLAGWAQGPSPRPPVAGPIDWGAEARETRELLKALIRIDTINPPQKGSPKKNADEESGGRSGAEYMVRTHWDKVDCAVRLAWRVVEEVCR